MLKIILCEDDANDREALRQMLVKLLFDKEEVIFECYEDGRDLVNVLETGRHIWADLIFLDITMPGLDGMETARILRKHHVNSQIVFVTAREDMVYQGYEVHAFAYLLKSMVAEKLGPVIHSYLEEQKNQDRQYLMVTKKKRKERIPLNEIKYLVSDRRKIKAILESPNESTEFYMKLGDLEEHLGGAGFLRCHQSYLINTSHVLYQEEESIILTGGEKIPVSRRYQKEVDQWIRG